MKTLRGAVAALALLLVGPALAAGLIGTEEPRPVVESPVTPFVRPGLVEMPADVFYPVASRIFFPNEVPDAANKYVLAQTHHLLYDDVVGLIRIQWPNLRATTGLGANGGAAEVAPGVAATATANLTYIDRTTKLSVTVNLADRLTGSTALTAPSGGLFDAVATINASKGDFIAPKFAGNFPNGAYLSQGQADYAGGDLIQWGASAIPLGNTPSNTYTGSQHYYGPVSIRSQTGIASYATVGDSRNSSLRDVANDIYGNVGQVGRLIGKRLPAMNVSVPGETAADFAVASQSPVRRALARQARSGGFLMLGTNDVIFQNKTANATKAFLDQIASSFGWGATAIYGTLDPTTSGGNAAIGRPGAPETERRAFNTAVRSLSRRFDPAAANEAGGAANPTGLWANAAYMTDETHESNLGNQNSADNAGFDFALVGSPTVVSAGFAYPAGALYQSLDFGTGWSGQQASLDATRVYSPEHKLSARILKEDATANANHGVFAQPALTLAGTTRKFTVFAKRAAGARNLMFQVQRTNDYTDGRILVNLGTGATFYSAGNGSSINVAGSAVTAFEGGWKIELTLTFAAGTNANPYVYLKMLDAGGADSFSGDGSSSLSIWGLDIR